MNVKELRKSKNLTQQQVADFIGVSLRTYKRFESEDNYLNDSETKKLLNQIKRMKNRGKHKTRDYKFLVIGAGYVGLALSLFLAQKYDTKVVDIDKEKLSKISKKECPIKDVQMLEELQKTQHISTSLPQMSNYLDADFIFICLPTNFNEDLKSLDTTLIRETIKEIRTVNPNSIIAIKSTCPPGFTDSINDNKVIYTPEFLQEGTAYKNICSPNRIVFGVNQLNNKVTELINIFRNLCKNDPQILLMNSKEAETVKLVSNTYLAMRVAFFNEVDTFAMENNISSKRIVEGICADERIGDYYNNPSFGFGGYCLPKDSMSAATLMKSDLIRSINKSNTTRKNVVANNIISLALKKSHKTKIEDLKIGFYNFNSKINSDRSTNSSTQDIYEILKKKNIDIVIYSKEKSLDEFVDNIDLLIVNRVTPEIKKYNNKMYTRDIFSRN